MIDIRNPGSVLFKFIGPIVLFSAIALVGSLAFGHGPKGHTGGDFTAFMAVKKGIELYDRLLTSGKFAESWEIDLNNVAVFTQNDGNQIEFVVKINRSKGEPKSVYIFFSEKGEYTGSNFTGD